MGVIFQWDKSFLTSIMSVDEQHQRLVDLINNLGDRVVSMSKIPPQEFLDLVGAIETYAKYHFRDEERLIEEKALDSRYLRKQELAHQYFLVELKAFQGSFSTTIEDQAQRLLVFLITWLTFHILEVDQSISRQLDYLAQGLSAQEAHDKDTDKIHVGSKSLVGAMNKLLEIVSDKNKELERLNSSLAAEVDRKTHDLQLANEQLKELSVHDELTGLQNRRFATLDLEQRFSEYRRYARGFAVLLIDADHFKEVNDRFGHPVGDLVLKSISSHLREATRRSDIVCRLGGDEFLIIAPDTDFAQALELARKVIETAQPVLSDANEVIWDGSLSVGTAEVTPEIAHQEELISRADKAMYLSKRRGGHTAS